MHAHRPVIHGSIICLALFMQLVLTPAAEATIYYDLGIKAAYEDNVVGLLSDKRVGTAGMTIAPGSGIMSAMSMTTGTPLYVGSSNQSSSDTSINLFANLGNSTRIAADTWFFVAGSVLHSSYSTYDQLDSTIGGLSTGITRGLGDIFTARVAISTGIKRYNDSERNSQAYGANLSLKEKLAPAFWLKESYDYEKNKADSPLFTYQGNAVSLGAGYLVTPQTTLLLVYNYLVRNFDQPSDFTVTAHTISLGMEE